jgi:hypothetical protein
MTGRGFHRRRLNVIASAREAIQGPRNEELTASSELHILSRAGDAARQSTSVHLPVIS